ncbi:polyribonucleotide nucleotidyltransferase [Patescibacteria group bacterium]|nr:polyribonucleotide nucleotidyltransferase [Patescibacteria group bacterium]
MVRQIFETTVGGKVLTAEIGDLTGQANGSVIMKLSETTVLVTAVMSTKTDPNLPYFPLSVEFEEKFYAAGQILGNRFSRREGKPTDEAVLSARLIDRTIRPLFPSHIRNEIQIVVSVLAIGEDDPDILGVIGASLALSISDIPWNGPVGAVRISRNAQTGLLSINGTYTERNLETLDFEVVTCGQHGTINMIEVGAREVSEADIMTILEASTIVHADLVTFQNKIVAALGKPKQEMLPPVIPELVTELFTTTYHTRLHEQLLAKTAGKQHLHTLKKEFISKLQATDSTLSPVIAGNFFEEMIDEAIHRCALELGVRADGRDFDTVRPLEAHVGGISPVLHGSGIFYRGDTHVLSVLTLGGPEGSMAIETIEGPERHKHFLHHYNFPPFSVGETGRVGGFNRRMIGHGALAEKALVPVLPPRETFPYTIRLVSETMSSNGSSSMASVCASSLALCDGGVPITRPVAGIASGVMMSGDKFVILTDIQGPEDEHGDMDFKVAGTTVGITAMQMDVKVAGVSMSILRAALEKARLARLHILETMNNTIASPRTHISPRAPEIILIKIAPEQIGLVIGGGGKTINKLKETSGVEEISIEDDGSVYITGKNGTAQKAATMIQNMTRVYTVGEELQVTITKITAFGAFAKMDDYHEGLIHISEVTGRRLETLEGILREGDVVRVAVIKADEGKIGLSIKKINPNFVDTTTT